MKVKTDNSSKAKVFFDPMSGYKIRMAEGEYVKAETPELVDVKITDYCAYGCSFCYQSSTKKGKHGDTEWIGTIVNSLAQLECFEIAFGGGETTQHPDFSYILKLTAENGIVPNFTTFGTDWLTDEEKLSAVREFVGGIGVSVHSAAQVKKYTRIRNEMNGHRPVVAAQHVFGTVSFEELETIVDSVGHILLLGYKTSGFGSSFTPFEYSEEQILSLLNMVKNKGSKLSIDSAFVEKYGQIMKEFGIDERLMASPEGKFSCYIDGVEKKIGPSSYCEKQMMEDFVPSPNHIKEVFRKW